MRKPNSRRPRLPRELFAYWLLGGGRSFKAITHWLSGGEAWRRPISVMQNECESLRKTEEAEAPPP